MQFSLDPRDMLRLLWRRKWFVVVPAALCTIGAFSTIALLPTLYESEATLLIEQQEIPEDVVQPLVSDVIERRLEVLTRRILTKDKLLEIANRFDLYEDERDKLSNGALAGRVRSRIETEILFAPITDGQGRTSRTALAFQIRFSDHDPAVAQGVTHDLVSAYVSSNIEDRRAVAQQATGFFAEERQKLQERIASIEAEFTEFKKDNREALPEEITFKRQQLTSIEQQLRNLNGRFRSLREQQSFLETQIALTNEFEERNARFNREAPEARLQAARSELAAAEARYRSGHPDVIRLRREVTALEAVVGERSGSSALAEQEALLSAELASLRERYTTEHPDVRRMQRKLGAVQEVLSAGNGAAGQVDQPNRNPTYVQLRAQLNSIKAEIEVIDEQRTELQSRQVAVQKFLAQAPEVEREYNRFVRALDSAIADRNALADKEASTKLSGSLQTTAVGEQLTMIDAPSFPNAPSSPDKKLILAIGAVLAAGSGAMFAGLAELLDRSVRSVSDLVRILDDAPLACIPQLVSTRDRWRRWLWRGGGLAVLLAVTVGALAYVHTAIVPLDVLGSQAMNQTESWVARTFPAFGDDEVAPGESM